MVCNLHFASRVGDNCRKCLQQLGFLHLTCLPSYFKEVLNFSISQVRKTHCYRSLVEWVKRRAIPHLFERLFLISWENNRDCQIALSLSLKTVEVQIKVDH